MSTRIHTFLHQGNRQHFPNAKGGHGAAVRRCLMASAAILGLLIGGQLLAQQSGPVHADPTVTAHSPEAAMALPPGDAAHGKALFNGNGACSSCHRVAGNGSRLGPDLTEIGAIRSPEQLQESLLDPNAEILPENRTFTVVTQEGKTITGRLLNQDTYYVQLMDQTEHLRSFDKSRLRSYSFVKTSPMPSYNGKLSAQELADVIAYLGTLKGLNPQ
jgi:putative heme-binding domain-containing protein